MFGGAIPFVTPGDLESDVPVRRSVTEDGASESVTVGPGAALVCCIGATIGKIGKASVRTAFNQQINAVDWHDNIIPDYGYAVLRFFRPTIIAWGTSTTLPILKKSTFERIEIPVPPLEEQLAFSAVARRVAQIEVSARKSLAGMDELFRSLQVRIFRGDL
jgi:type I restriction enzyme S subunit